MMLLISNIVVKAKEIEVTDSIIGRAQAIVAYEMNLVSLKQYSDSVYTQFKEKIGGEITFESIKKMEDFCRQKRLRKNLSLIKEIKGLKPDSGVDIIPFYSDSIFKNTNSEIGEFFKDKPDSIKIKLCEDIEEALSVGKVVVTNNSEGEDNGKNRIGREEKESSSCIWTLLIPYFLLLGTVAVIVLLFKRDKELEKKIVGLIREYNDELSNKENEVQQLKKEVRELNHQCEELIKSRDEVEEFYQGQLNSRTRKEPVKETQKEQENVQEDNQPKAYFVTSPKNDVFDEGTNTYRPGKAIYKIVSWDDISGEFEFINSKEAVDYARQSKSQYVEPACNILNDGDMAIEGIATERKGKVKRVDNGWSIIEKANVRLM